MQDRAAEPVQGRDDNGVALASDLEHRVRLRAGGFRTEGGVDVDVGRSDAGTARAVDWVGGVLLGGGDPPYR